MASSLRIINNNNSNCSCPLCHQKPDKTRRWWWCHRQQAYPLLLLLLLHHGCYIQVGLYPTKTDLDASPLLYAHCIYKKDLFRLCCWHSDCTSSHMGCWNATNKSKPKSCRQSRHVGMMKLLFFCFITVPCRRSTFVVFNVVVAAAQNCQPWLIKKWHISKKYKKPRKMSQSRTKSSWNVPDRKVQKTLRSFPSDGTKAFWFTQ